MLPVKIRQAAIKISSAAILYFTILLFYNNNITLADILKDGADGVNHYYELLNTEINEKIITGAQEIY